MKRTGRRLTLSNDINSLTPPGSINSTDWRLATIFEDNREGYGWKIVDIKQLIPIGERNPPSWALMSIRPDAFDTAADFLVWAAERQPWDNSLIGTFYAIVSTNYSLRTEHVATNHLSMFYPEGTIPYYNITLEEYDITPTEEIMFKIKETSQSLSEIGA